ncbi:GIY-YIG nuclease family protein [Myxococcus sp. CA040A]|uniref:GIY-YIG nuclease family protein n=1 Tax=Myxococcus sp. CA040A TaxID=2741738 RepID=UPI00157A67C2|nr:GIY-YIG nuclease family protein [Myxococcus sp. CA040A]NTX08288.1 GIY-YIG nuclease family protein [Myxococcus sp. CA040A]
MSQCPHEIQLAHLRAELAQEREARRRADASVNRLTEATYFQAQALVRHMEVSPPSLPQPPPPQQTLRRASPPSQPEPSFVYFVQAGDGGPIKIGFSRNPRVRMQELQTGNAVELKYCGEVVGDQGLERILHERFAAIRLHGEWFTATRELVDYIRYMLAADGEMRAER